MKRNASSLGPIEKTLYKPTLVYPTMIAPSMCWVQSETCLRFEGSELCFFGYPPHIIGSRDLSPLWTCHKMHSEQLKYNHLV